MDKPTFLLTIEPGGICIFNQEPTNSQHRHPYWEICIVLRGTGEYIQDGMIYPLSAGCLFASPPDVLHEIRSLETRDLEIFFVSFTCRPSTGVAPEEADGVVDAFVRDHHVICSEAEPLHHYAELIGRGSTAMIRDQLARIFTFEAMNVLAASPHRITIQNIHSPEVHRALRYIDSQCLRKLTVSEVASHVNLAPRSLLRRFQIQVGHSISKEIRQKKMRKAAHQLLMGHSVQEVAQIVGIDDPSQLSALFLAEIGLRPKAFQQTYLPGSLGPK